MRKIFFGLIKAKTDNYRASELFEHLTLVTKNRFDPEAPFEFVDDERQAIEIGVKNDFDFVVSIDVGVMICNKHQLKDLIDYMDENDVSRMEELSDGVLMIGIQNLKNTCGRIEDIQTCSLYSYKLSATRNYNEFMEAFAEYDTKYPGLTADQESFLNDYYEYGKVYPESVSDLPETGRNDPVDMLFCSDQVFGGMYQLYKFGFHSQTKVIHMSEIYSPATTKFFDDLLAKWDGVDFDRVIVHHIKHSNYRFAQYPKESWDSILNAFDGPENFKQMWEAYRLLDHQKISIVDASFVNKIKATLENGRVHISWGDTFCSDQALKDYSIRDLSQKYESLINFVYSLGERVSASGFDLYNVPVRHNFIPK